VRVFKVSRQILFKTVAVIEYVTTSTPNELINNVNVVVSINKTYYILYMFMNVKERKITKKELQKREN